MNDVGFSFGDSPWERYLQDKRPGDRVSAAHMLAMLEDTEEEALEDALAELEERGAELDISDLPRAAGDGAAAARLRRETQLARQGLDYRQLEQSDPLRLYLEELAENSDPLDEAALVPDAAGGDPCAMERLAEAGLPRVTELARQYVGYGVLLMDLIQEGSLALWQAVRDYRQGDYAAYRDRAVTFAMARAVVRHARQSGAGKRLRQSLEDYRTVDERLLGELGRNPSLEEIAQALHISPEQASILSKMLEDARLVAAVRDQQPATEEDRQAQGQPVESTAAFHTRQRILDLLSVLSQEDSRLLTLRFGLEGSKPLSAEETSRQLGLTPEEVLQREAAALAKLRNA